MKRTNPWRENSKISEDIFDEIFFRVSSRQTVSEIYLSLKENNVEISLPAVRRNFDYIVNGLFSDSLFICTVFGIFHEFWRFERRTASNKALCVDMSHFRVSHIRQWISEEVFRKDAYCFFECTRGPNVSDIRFFKSRDVEISHEIRRLISFKREKCSSCHVKDVRRFEYAPAMLEYASKFRSNKNIISKDTIFRLIHWQELFSYLRKNVDCREKNASQKAYSKTVYDPWAIDWSKSDPRWQATYRGYYTDFFAHEDKKFVIVWDTMRYLFKYCAIYRLRMTEKISDDFLNPFGNREIDHYNVAIGLGGFRKGEVIDWLSSHKSNFVYG